MHTLFCRACGSAETSLKYSIDGYDIFSCACCGSMTTASHMSTPDARAFYGFEYFHGGDYHDYEATEMICKRNFARSVDRLRAIQPKGRLLELGCAYGYFLDLAKAHWEVSGIDVSLEAVSACAERFGEAVQSGEFLNVRWPQDCYDLVVAWDTVEHLDQPRDYLQQMCALLKPRGYVALTTGDVSSLAARVMGHRWRLFTPPSHLTLFSRQGMERALLDAGFRSISFSTAGYDRSLSFAAYRLLRHRYRALLQGHERASRFLQQASFYINLGDIMFVVARKPDRPQM